MRTNTLAWLVIALFMVLIGWWWLDPVGFSQNPLITWFKGLHFPLPERFRQAGRLETHLTPVIEQ